MLRRIALLGIYHESNTFALSPTTLTDFENGHSLTGNDIRKEYQDAHHEVGGMIEVIDRAGMELVPVVFSEATPGGTISAETYETLLDQMLEKLDAVLPVDGVLVVPHGAGVSEDFPDMDGHWISKIRKKLGPDMPIVGTLDLHANVSPLMAESANALVSYKKNPHIDQRQTGKAAAEILVKMVNSEAKPIQALIQIPLAISIEQHFTSNEPCKSLYALADELSKMEGILSISILLGFPYADVQEMGTSLIVVSDNHADLATRIGKQLESYILDNRDLFIGIKNDIPATIDMIGQKEKPVLLLDMGDNIGGGSPGNNICLLEGLEEDGTYKYFVCLYDPEAVQRASKHQPGETFSLSMNGTVKDGSKNIELEVKLLRLSDGHFTEANPRHGGQANYDMGKTAVVARPNGSVIMLTSLRVPPFSLGQLTSCDVDPEAFDVIIAKGVVAPLAAYAPVCPSIIQVNTPGVTQADMTMFSYKNRRKPLFPFENP
ncbi:M81 family metallopeptidase [Dyadobacter sp. CY323]|uniref:M81 family metallopeptidase n=1 Tax=Dyadobacter sp. CY323 TaxID=2907302 RepID=UPI001F237C75|nr:M81 family metallopeptidase [Dyadobacter sp. CY323]MCE6993138.1 M81 family metallopeptidase [Dyadobacter sp. CY323]